jgi:hypothetical protein
MYQAANRVQGVSYTYLYKGKYPRDGTDVLHKHVSAVAAAAVS